MSIIGNAILLGGGGGGGGSVVVWDELDVHGGTIRHIEAANTYSSGDNLSYGTAGLAGTTWYFNETISLPSGNVSYALNFTSNSTDYLEMSKVGPPGTLKYGNELVYVDYGFIAPVWATAAYRTISITGGTDATNADLIAWIEANATEVTS